MLMTNSPKPDVPTTSVALTQEVVRSNWNERLSKCREERVDEIKHFDEGEKEYHTRTLSRHYENGVQIAISITYDYHAGNSRTTYLMLLIDGARHYVP
jgi:hypothetical protein